MANINTWLKLIKTSKICHSLNGKIFKVKDMIPGINAPLCTLGAEVLQCHMWATGEINSLMSVKESIKQRIKNQKKKIQEKAKRNA